MNARPRFIVLMSVLFAPGSLAGQVSLTLSQAPNVFPAPGVADYNAGLIVNPTAIGYTLDATGAASSTRTATVSIRSSSATLGGTKALSDLQWRRVDLGTWNSMTTSDVTVETVQMKKNVLNDTHSNSVLLRMLLSWTTDAPATYSAGLVFTLTVTTP